MSRVSRSVGSAVQTVSHRSVVDSIIRKDFPALLAGSSIWMSWSILSVIIADVGYPFSVNELFSLIATAGLSGTFVRLGSSYLFVKTSGALLWLVSLSLLVCPLWMIVECFSSLDTPLWAFQIAALLSGIGAALLPIRTCMEDFSLKGGRIDQEVRSALADGGLIVAQVLLPVLGFLPFYRGEFLRILEHDSSNILGKVSAGQSFWISGSLSVIAILLSLAVLRVLPKTFNEKQKLYGVCRISAIYAFLLVFCFTVQALFSLDGFLNDAVLLGFIIVAATLFLLFMFFFRIPRGRESGLLPLIMNRQLQLLSLLQLMGAGSLLGFAAVLPLLGRTMFDFEPAAGGVYSSRPVGPGVLTYIWLLPVIGVIARGVSAWIVRYYKPEKINQAALIVMFVCSVCLAINLGVPVNERSGEVYFLLLILFYVGSGVSAGSVFYQIVKSFPAALLPRVLIWIGGISSFGVFYIANMFANYHGVVDISLIVFGFALFYAVGIVINWFFFMRRKSEMSF